jgi:hypothetical protein
VNIGRLEEDKQELQKLFKKLLQYPEGTTHLYQRTKLQNLMIINKGRIVVAILDGIFLQS